MKIERRFIHELRADSQGDEMSLMGYAAKFNNPSEDLGGFRETILPGAFGRSIREGQDVRFLMNHAPDKVMGRTKNGTLKLEEDGTGLKFRVMLPDTQDARDLHTLVKRGDIDSCSFAFTARDQSWEDVRNENGDIYANRKLMDVDLQDVSAVTYPAYPNTEVNARALFPDGEPVELRSAIASLEEKREKQDEDTEKRDWVTIDGTHVFIGKDGTVEKGPKDSIGKNAHDLGGKSYEKVKTDKPASHLKNTTYMKNGHTVNVHENKTINSVDVSHTQNKNVGGIKGTSTSEKTFDQKGANTYLKSMGINHDFQSLGKGARDSSDDSEERAAGQSLVIQPNDKTFPQPFDDKMKSDWCDAYADALKDAIKRQKLEYQDAVAYAYATANQKLQPQTEVDPEVSGQKKDPSDVPHEIVDTNREGEPPKENPAKKNPNRSEEDEAIEARVYKTPSHPNGKEDVPSNVPDSKKAQWKEVWNSAYKAAKKDGMSDSDAESKAFATANGVIKKRATEKCSCRCMRCIENDHRGCVGNPTCVMGRSQKVSDPQSDDYDPDDDMYDPDWDDFEDEESGDEGRKKVKEEDPDDEVDGEDRSGGKTKKVAGKNLSSSAFAFVGDPEDTSTWKFPVHDKAHAQNALARWGQAKGIPADKKDGVHKKIVAAAKKFGISVSEEKSLDDEATLRSLQARQRMIKIDVDLYDEAILRALRARQRMIEIDLDL